MATITKWALQIMALVLLAWLASVAGQWSSQVVNGTSNERLAQLAPLPEPVMVSAARTSSDTQVR
ncbi:hypothetical protein [Pseudomonas sp. 3A(2025)]